MPAFTQICEKYNLSLFDDTLTVYFKENDSKMDNFLLILIAGYEPESDELDKLLDREKTKLNITRYIHREDFDHNRYHRDNFDYEKSHVHIKFKTRVNEEHLTTIINIFVANKIISKDEGKQFLKTFKSIQSDKEGLFIDVLATMGAKVSELESDTLQSSHYKLTRGLYINISDAFDAYLNNKSLSSFNIFKNICLKEVNQVRPLLKGLHSSWNNLINRLHLAMNVMSNQFTKKTTGFSNNKQTLFNNKPPKPSINTQDNLVKTNQLSQEKQLG